MRAVRLHTRLTVFALALTLAGGVNLTAVSNAVEKAKAHGVLGLGYDDSVNHEVFRDFVDANRKGIADVVEGVNTIPSINMVFEKAYTWALPAIVGGIAAGTEDGEAWGVLNNVNDRFKSCASHYPAGGEDGEPSSMTDQCLPTQESGTGFSYTIEHEAAHNLGLSHPHDGSYGVDKCPEGHPDAGKWKCYWMGLGWMYDISAAPTTYAMAYRPYEVEDQDNLQRGHVAEYLVGSQEALTERLAWLAEQNHFDKIFFKATKDDWQEFLRHGYMLEGILRYYFRGEDAYVLSKFRSTDRVTSEHLIEESDIIERLMRSSGTREPRALPEGYSMKAFPKHRRVIERHQPLGRPSRRRSAPPTRARGRCTPTAARPARTSAPAPRIRHPLR